MSSPFDAPDQSPLDTFAYEALTVTGSATAFTTATMVPDADVGGPAFAAFCTVEGAAIRVRADGTDPTATVGTPYKVGDKFVVWGKRDLDSFRAIRQGGVSATLSTEFVRRVT